MARVLQGSCAGDGQIAGLVDRAITSEVLSAWAVGELPSTEDRLGRFEQIELAMSIM